MTVPLEYKIIIMYTTMLALFLNVTTPAISSESLAGSVHALTGELTEVILYYPGGEVLQRGYMLDGEKTGEWITYAISGEVTAKAYYIAGEKTGTWKVYDNEGNVAYKIKYRDGKKLWARSFDEDGNQTAMTYK